MEMNEVDAWSSTSVRPSYQNHIPMETSRFSHGEVCGSWINELVINLQNSKLLAVFYQLILILRFFLKNNPRGCVNGLVNDTHT